MPANKASKQLLQNFASSSVIGAITRAILSSRKLVGRIFSNLKYRALVKDCANSVCHFSCEIKFGENIHVGENTRIGKSVTLGGKGGIFIGKNVIISKNVTIETASLDLMKGLPFTENNAKPIVIGDNSWIGSNSIILAGVTIGENVIIGAGSVVTKNVADKTIATAPRELEKYEIRFRKPRV